MGMRKQTYYILGFFAALSLAVGCTDSKVIDETTGTDINNYKESQLGGEIGWSITTENGNVFTRAQGLPASVAAIRKEKDVTDSIRDTTVDVGVFGYYTGDKNFWSITDTAGDKASIKANLFINERLTWKEDDDTAYWSHPTHRHWPVNYCTFMSYSPYLSEIPKVQVNQYKKDGMTNNRYWFFYRNYDAPGKPNLAEDMTAQALASEAYKKGWWKPGDSDSLLHLTEYKKGDTVMPAIRYIMPYHLAIHPDILYGTYGTHRFQDITHDKDAPDDYVHFTMRHALAKSYWYLTSQIDLSNTASLLGSLKNENQYYVSVDDMSDDDIKKAPKGENFTDENQKVWKLDKYYYEYQRQETKLVIEELTFMDFYDRGTLPLLNDGVPQWYDREPNVSNADNGLNAKSFENPINRAIVYNSLLNDTISLNWNQYDSRYYAGFSETNPTNEYEAKYDSTFLVRRLDKDNNQMNANFTKDPRFRDENASKEFSVITDTSDFKITLDRWETWSIKHTEGADDNNGKMETSKMISMLGNKGQLYVMNIPQEASHWTPMARLRYRTIGLDRGTRIYQYKNESETKNIETNYDSDHNFYFYVVNPMRTSSGYFNRDLVGGRRYKMKISLNAEYLEILADIQDWDVEDITYSDVKQGVTVPNTGAINWVKSTDGFPKTTSDGKVYLNQFNGMFTFLIASPIGATWTATLVTTGGENGAFNFYTDDSYTTVRGNGTTISDKVDGKTQTVYVRATNLHGGRSADNTAILRFFITYADGSENSELITQLTGSDQFSEWTLVQSKN